MSCLNKVLAFIAEKNAKGEKQFRVKPAKIKEFAAKLDALQAQKMNQAEFDAAVQKLFQADIDQFNAKVRAERTLNVLKRETIITNMRDGMAKGKSPSEAFRNWVEGGALRRGADGNISIRGLERAEAQRFLNIWRRATEGLQEIAERSKTVLPDVYQELWALQKGLATGGSGSKEALALAQGIHAVQTKAIQMKKAYNPFFEELDDYLIRQIHVREKVSAGGRDAWVQDAMKAFGEKSFPELSPESKLERFRDIYDQIESGRYDQYTAKMSGGPDLQRRMTMERKLIASDWQAIAEYNSKYGWDTTEEVVQQLIRSTARDISMLDKFGSNPRAMFDDAFTRFHSTLDENGKAELEASRPHLEASWRMVTNQATAPARSITGRVGRIAMTWQYMARTGGAFLRSLQDSVMAMSSVRSADGLSLFENAQQLAGAYFKNIRPEYSKGVAEDLHLGLQSLAAALQAELGVGSGMNWENAKGNLDRADLISTKMADLFGKANLLNFHVRAASLATAEVASMNMARIAEKDFASLSKHTQDVLARYGLDGAKWDLVRTAVEDVHGKKFMTPEAIEALPDAQVEAYMRAQGLHALEAKPSARALDRARYELSHRLSAYLHEQADIGSTTPGIRQQTFMTGGLAIDDRWGLTRRLLFQFKGAALMTADNYQRLYHSETTPKGRFASVASTAVLSAFVWAVGDQLKQLASGQAPEDPRSLGYLARATVGSGLGGMMGDSIANAMGHQGSVAMRVKESFSGLIGPVPGMLAEPAIAALSGVKAWDEGKDTRFGADMAAWATRNTPGQNLFYAKSLIDYYYIDAVREFVGPGYLGNLERMMSREDDWFGQPRERLFPGGR